MICKKEMVVQKAAAGAVHQNERSPADPSLSVYVSLSLSLSHSRITQLGQSVKPCRVWHTPGLNILNNPVPPLLCLSLWPIRFCMHFLNAHIMNVTQFCLQVFCLHVRM